MHGEVLEGVVQEVKVKARYVVLRAVGRISR
jgi:hypothetical protein